MSYDMTTQVLGCRIVSITYPQKGSGETTLTFEDGRKLILGACESIEVEIPAKGGIINWKKEIGDV